MAWRLFSALLTLAVSSQCTPSCVGALQQSVQLNNVPRRYHTGGPWNSPATLRIHRGPFDNIKLPVARDDDSDAAKSPRRRRTSASAFPPPRDESDIRVMEKEVHETIRLLDGLKLGADKRRRSPSSSLPPPTHQLSRQQRQEKELMQSLKQSLKRTQRKSATLLGTNFTAPSPSEDSNVESSGRPGHAELMENHAKQLRARPANYLKAELSNLGLSDRGRKPDLVIRLAEHLASRDASGGADETNRDSNDENYDDRTESIIPTFIKPSSSINMDRPISFAGIPRLSTNAAIALHQAFGGKGDEIVPPEPTPIQSVAIPHLFFPPNPSALLHAPTGSGKTIAYLLPITETLWKEIENDGGDDMANGMALILLPTRELAAQVAGVASVLAPPGMVRLVPRPMDLMSTWNYEVDRGEEYEYFESLGEADSNEEGRDKKSGRKYQPRILVGSAKAISTSLFGDTKMPGTPTSKPEGKRLLSSVRWLVMDEVDRLLNIEKSRSDKKSKRHERPAALLAAAVARLTVGRAQIIAASATIGRPLRRELSRVLGLHSSECPETLRGEDDDAKLGRMMVGDERHVGRAVKIPDAVRNFVLPVDGSTAGSLLTAAAFASKTILRSRGRKVLLVLTRNCDIKVHNALGALRHFGIRPEPQSLLDVLEADGIDRLVEAHRRVSRVEGVGGARDRNGKRGANILGGEDEGYLLITHEDNVRGLHLDGLDAVIVVGRPGSPDEYTHIAGRVGRAGRRGSVLNIVSFEQAAALASWTMMLGVDFLPVEESELATVVDD